MMASETYDNLCNELYGDIFRRLERREEETLRFVPWGTCRDILQQNDNRNLRRFFRSLATADQSSEQVLRLTETAFVQRVNERDLLDFLGTLIFATCSIRAARTCVDRLVAGDAPPHGSVGRLPASRAQLEQLLGSDTDADRFISKQGCFCAVVLRKKEEVRIDGTDSPRLPYLEEIPLGEGSFGKVFRVRVARGHFHDRQAGPAFGHNVEPIDMARKDYIVADKSKAREEYDVMRQILGSTSRNCENIVESLGALEVGTNYSLFMPLAMCDLRSYMMSGHHIPPQTQEARAEIISCAAGLASGLQFLHTGIRTVEFDELVCYHMDLNPSNILVFKEVGEDGSMRWIWKLSDFGMARVKVRRRAVAGDRENDFNSLFVRRKKIADPSVSATLNRRGEGTYLPPESISATASMRTSSDVWALGCVLSVVLTFLETGAEGVCHYQDARMDHRRADGYDRFFLRGTRFTEPDVHPQVRVWHKVLREKAARRSVTEGHAMSYMLDFLEQSVIRVTQRCTAEDVKKRLEEMYRLYRSAEEPRRGSILETISDSPLAVRLRTRQGNDSSTVIDEWYPSTSRDFKGCAISPDANVLAYWTDDTIVLYTSQSLATRERHTVTYAADWTLPNTDCDCFLKHVCLTSKYLIASTAGRSRLYIFYLLGGDSVDYNFSKLHRLVLQLPAISKIAISSDSVWVALTARASTNPRDPGVFLYATVRDLIDAVELAPRAPNLDNPARDESINTHPLPDQHPFKPIALEWSAADVIHLALLDSRDAYLVVRPELTTRSREHKIPITHVSLDRHPVTMDTLNMTSLGYDVGAFAGLYTAFCPFHDRNTCAVVTREKRLHVQKFEGSDKSLELQREIPKYRISQLLSSCPRPRGRLLAIGAPSAKHQMVLLEIHLTPELHVQQLAHLPGLLHGDDFAAVLSDDDSEPCVIVASLTGASRRVIYKVRLASAEVT
ncbi:hypothetical protein JDV02_002966 [Purpureocillium takamizusanense]|uniref:Protein kinase domain-containing protein n=1 Tax=Purpureocillium takamizusanense TaxID=2060973 RepID=A0A9Q8Q9Q2_9HYPO|nr:uncharacterized protein JDV02_002966 [Purpureocillium takamizusanense]UNI16539.1 hypothetical protein JDV02_002966 [Purpureocillium takamizusanense]